MFFNYVKLKNKNLNNYKRVLKRLALDYVTFLVLGRRQYLMKVKEARKGYENSRFPGLRR